MVYLTQTPQYPPPKSPLSLKLLAMIHDPVLGFIFVKTTKVAGSSFEASIAPFLSRKAIVTINENWSIDQSAASVIRLRKTHWLPLSRLLAQMARHPSKVKSIPLDLLRRRGPRHECFSKETDHMTAQQIRDHVGQTEWDRCLKVAIVRSPYDRIQSDYFMKKNSNLDSINFPSFAEWVIQNPERILRNKRILELSVEDSSGIQKQVIDIDHVIYYEDFETGLRSLANKLNLNEDRLWERFKTTKIHSQFRTDESRLNPEKLLNTKTKRVIDLLLDSSFDFFAYIKQPQEQNHSFRDTSPESQVS